MNNSNNFDATLIALLAAEFVSMDDAARIDAIMSMETKDRYLLASMMGKALKAGKAGTTAHEAV